MSNSNSNNNNPITNNNLFSGKVEKFQFEHKNNSAKAKKERKKARKTLKRERRLNKERRVRDSIPLPTFLRSGKKGISRFLNSRNVASLASTSKAMRGVAPFNNRLPPANRPITTAGRERRQFKSLPLPKDVSSAITSYLTSSNLQSLEATGKTFGNTVSHNTLHNRKRAARARQPVTMTELAARGNAEAKREFREFHLGDFDTLWWDGWRKGYYTPSDVSRGDYNSNDEWKNGLYDRLKQAEGDNHMARGALLKGESLRGKRPVRGRRRRKGNTSLQSAVSNAEESLHTNPNFYRLNKKRTLKHNPHLPSILNNRSLHGRRMEHPRESIKKFRRERDKSNSNSNSSNSNSNSNNNNGPPSPTNRVRRRPRASGNGEGGGETKSTRRRKKNNKKNNNKKTKNRKKNGGRKTRKKRSRR